MSVLNLDSVFAPASIALIGASARPGSVGDVVTRNLLSGGFTRPVMLVNPHREPIEGHPVYADVASLPEAPELAVIATPPATVPDLIAELGARGTKAAVVITAGFGELGADGKALQKAALEAAKPRGLRIVGPNCVGVMAPASGVNASFGHLTPAKGGIAFVSQSGAMITAVLDWAVPHQVGFSKIVSLGDMADVDFGDMLAYLANDTATSAILLYVEGITHAHKFMAAARAAARNKPVLAVKVGRHAESARAARSHTGALAGSDGVYDAAFRRAGILRVLDTEQLFDAAETLSLTREQRGDRLAILTNGGGPGVMATDALIDLGGHLAELGPGTIARLDAVLPKTWSRGNPVDIIGDAPGSRYRKALDVLLEAPEVDAVLALNCPTAVGNSEEAARAVIGAVAEAAPGALAGRNVFTSWLGEHSAGPAREAFSDARIATYETPDRAVRGFMDRVQYQRIAEFLQSSSGMPQSARDAVIARNAITGALDDGREWLDVIELAAVFAAYGIPFVKTKAARDPSEAAAVAQAIGFPVALKIGSRDITHKSDVGGVALKLGSPDEVREGAIAMLARVGKAVPNARIEGFVVQQMISRPEAVELIVGVIDDATFGPVVLFGQGGVAVEVVKDSALELPPLDDMLARGLITRTRVCKLLQGYRNRPPADLAAVSDVLQRVSLLVSDHAEIRELDINPLLADADGVIAVDARIRVARAEVTAEARLAISP
jgi:acetyltransferase